MRVRSTRLEYSGLAHLETIPLSDLIRKTSIGSRD